MSEEAGPAIAVQAHKPRRPFRVIASIFIIAVLTLVLLEVILRFIGLTRPILYMRDDEIGYRLKPNQHIRYLGNEITVNSWGVRDPRPFQTKDPSKKRILVLGDSVTWGGILESQDELFTSVAENALTNVEIINGGVNGYSIVQMVGLYRSHLRELEPDIVIVCPILRDFTRPATVELTGNGVSFPEVSPRYALPEALAICRQSAQDRFGWTWLNAPPAIRYERGDGSENEDANLAALTGLADELRGKKQFGVAFAPTLQRQKLVAEMDQYLKIFLRNHIASVRLRAQVEYTAADFVDAVHLSSQGHQKAGLALADFIREKMLNDAEDSSATSQNSAPAL